MGSHDQPVPSLSDLRQWMAEGPRKEDISDETEYCDKEILAGILRCKTIFDRLENDELIKARSR